MGSNRNNAEDVPQPPSTARLGKCPESSGKRYATIKSTCGDLFSSERARRVEAMNNLRVRRVSGQTMLVADPSQRAGGKNLVQMHHSLSEKVEPHVTGLGLMLAAAENPHRKCRVKKVDLRHKEVEFATIDLSKSAVPKAEKGEVPQDAKREEVPDSPGRENLGDDISEPRRHQSESATTHRSENNGAAGRECVESEEERDVNVHADAGPLHSVVAVEIPVRGTSMDAVRVMFEEEELRVAEAADDLKHLRKGLVDIISALEYDTLMQARNKYHSAALGHETEHDTTVPDMPGNLPLPLAASPAEGDGHPMPQRVDGTSVMKCILDMETQFHKELVSLNNMGAEVVKLNASAAEWKSATDNAGDEIALNLNGQGSEGERPNATAEEWKSTMDNAGDDTASKLNDVGVKGNRLNLAAEEWKTTTDNAGDCKALTLNDMGGEGVTPDATTTKWKSVSDNLENDIALILKDTDAEVQNTGDVTTSEPDAEDADGAAATELQTCSV